MLPLAFKIFGIAVAITLLILMILYVAFAGTLRDTRGRLRVMRGARGGGARRRRGDVEGGEAGTGGDSQTVRSVHTLPRYTPGDGDGCCGVAGQRGHGGEGGEGEGRVGGEEVKPPPYAFDAGGAVAGEAGDGDGDGDGDRDVGEGRAGLPVSPDAVHVPR